MAASPEGPSTTPPVERVAGKASSATTRSAARSRRFPPSTGRGRERGQVLLALLLVLIVGSSYMLLKALNSALRQARYQRETADVLGRAKAALVGYAATYPDRFAGQGPGYLPCPDTNDDGSPDPPCGPDAIGRLPWEYLGLTDPRDSSGAHLWYAVSDNFRNNPKYNGPMNSEGPPGQLSVDGRSDVVAVILAPGSAFEFQNRPSNNAADYLEQSNASGTGAFQSGPGTVPGPFNDQLIAITRQELMDAVRKRVLGEVAQDLSTYRTRFGAYPWLAAFSNPATALTFTSDASTLRHEGQLAFQVPPDMSASLASPLVVPQVFPTTFTFFWSVPSGGSVTISPVQTAPLWRYPIPPAPMGSTVTAAQVRNAPVTVASVTVDPPAQCEWKTFHEVTVCSGKHTVPNGVPGFPVGMLLPNGFRVYSQSRTYEFTISYAGQPAVPPGNYHCPVSGGVTADCIVDPSASHPRTRTIYRTGAFPAGTSVTVKITDRVILSSFGFPAMLVTSSGTGTFDETASGTLETSGITYDLDPSPADPQTPWTPELPRWFIENKWQDLVYVAYAPGEALPGGATACVPSAGNCLKIDDKRGTPNVTENDVRALAIAAGDVLSSPPLQQKRDTANGTLGDYFEGENATPGDGVFERELPSSTFNDQIRVISRAP